MEDETFIPRAKTCMFRGLELVFTYKHCNKPSVNVMFGNTEVKKFSSLWSTVIHVS